MELGHKASLLAENAVDGFMLDTLTDDGLKIELKFSKLQLRKFRLYYNKAIIECEDCMFLGQQGDH